MLIMLLCAYSAWFVAHRTSQINMLRSKLANPDLRTELTLTELKLMTQVDMERLM